MIGSPDNLKARYCVKRSTEWTGYKVYFTETCQAEYPRLITQVETTPSTVYDVKATARIQEDLAGPVPSSKSWQDQTERVFVHNQFQIDWDKRLVTCRIEKPVRGVLSVRPGEGLSVSLTCMPKKIALPVH